MRLYDCCLRVSFILPETLVMNFLAPKPSSGGMPLYSEGAFHLLRALPE